MLQELRPLSIIEIFERAIRLYCHHFALLMSMAAWALVPMIVLAVLSEIVWHTTEIVDWVQNPFVLVLAQGGLVLAISGVYLNQPLSIREAYRLCLRRYLSLWGASIMAGLAIGIPLMVLALVLGAVIGPGEASVLVILGLLAVPYIVYLFIRWLMILPTIMLEDLGAADGLQRSWYLTGGMFWRVAGVWGLLYLLTFFVVSLPTSAMTLGMNLLLPGQAITSVITVIVTQLGNILTMPLAAVVTVVLYHDLRVRKKGQDLRAPLRAMDGLEKEFSAHDPITGPCIDPRIGPQVQI